VLSNFPKNAGTITKGAIGANYFAGLKQVNDTTQNVTSAQGLNTVFSGKALADANGNIVLANAAPGLAGTLGRTWIQGPSHIKMDVNLVKRFRLTESKNLEIRVDAINVLNKPWWNDPVTEINSTSFGRMDANDVTTGTSNADNRSAN